MLLILLEAFLAFAGGLYQVADDLFFFYSFLRALYVLLQDFKDAAKKVDLVLGQEGLTDARIKDLCVDAFRNAYESLQVGKAEVYCYEEFAVMVDMAGRAEEGKYNPSLLPYTHRCSLRMCARLTQ